MEVFLIPLGADRHELYCEAPQTEAEQDDEAAEPGFIARLKHRFTQVIAAAEQDRRRQASGEPVTMPESWWGRLKCRALAWVADTIAEQRLLWHLRHQERAHLHFPADLGPERAMLLARGSLTRDRDRHWFWLLLDSLLLILSVALILVPGPNVIGYYFAFRVVGHYLSWRGARQGLEKVAWEPVPSEPLVELRRALALAPTVRERQVLDIAGQLKLEELPTFVQRVAWPGA